MIHARIESPLGIIGTGLIGGSIALRARSNGVTVIGYDRDATSVAAAFERGAIDRIATSLEGLTRACRTVVVAVPVDATAAVLDRLVGLSGPDLVLDVASVKVPFMRYVGRVSNFVATHPMAGRESGGITFADAALFERATWAYVPQGEAALADRAQAFIKAMGGVALPIDAVRHDAIVALTSHLPQALSVVLGAQVAAAATHNQQVTELCGTGMMSMLRLARSPQAMWEPIFTANAEPLANQLRSLAAALDTVATELDKGDSPLLISYFDTARRMADSLQERFRPATAD